MELIQFAREVKDMEALTASNLQEFSTDLLRVYYGKRIHILHLLVE